ncbi:mycofactocin radical SAM maturase [Nocardia sp. NPDC058666]|uniref:mycofactocin radical SAM maturase n=1 Tax=Nocardia sp. NPDC058666 TaxID=3346587 RepID=UPI0036647A06
MLDLDTRWTLHPRVSLRPESFGALLYHFGTRKLSFLKSRDLVDVVRSLPAHPSVRSALHAKGIDASDMHIKALAQLADTDMIVPAPGPVTEAPLALVATGEPQGGKLIDRFESGLAAPICLTWELTYACNLSCVHCLSSSGRRDPDELSTEQCKALIDEFERMQIFYVNIGGGEPTVRPDFWELVDYATAHNVGVKFSTNGVRINEEVAARLAASDYVDVQISLDGADAAVNDAVRGPGSYDTAIKALSNLYNAGFKDAKLSVVATRHNISQLDEFKAIADKYGATLRLTRLRPSGRGADVWDELHPLPEQQRELYDWLVANGEGVLTGDSFFHLSAFGSALPGLNMCGAGRVVCLVDPVGDVYACPFAIHDRFKAGNIVADGGFDEVWTHSPLFAELREPVDGGACTKCSHYDSCRGGCMAAKFFTGLPANGPDPECVQGYGEAALTAPGRTIPRPAVDHSRPVRAKTRVSLPLTVKRPPAKACNESPLG